MTRYSDIDIDKVCHIARKAGDAIIQIYGEDDFAVETKENNSPLTAADKAAHEVISKGLSMAWPEIPILSEEGADIPYAERKGWQRFWMVDPLDGTKEFIKRNDEFTVNIALIERDIPVVGVVYVPVLKKMYVGISGLGAWVENDLSRPVPIHVRQPDPEIGLSVVMSRSHPSPELEQFLKTIKVAEAISVGSSLKLCVVAEGKADLYPRLGPTMEWDTAAGQAVVEAAGGEVKTLEGYVVLYNKPTLVNDYFVVQKRASKNELATNPGQA